MEIAIYFRHAFRTGQIKLLSVVSSQLIDTQMPQSSLLTAMRHLGLALAKCLTYIILVYVAADTMYDDYAGPYVYSDNKLRMETCPTRGRTCANFTYRRRKLPGAVAGLETGWSYNATINNLLYIQKSTMVRAKVSTRQLGSRTKFSSLIDVTKPACEWLDFVKPMTQHIFAYSGYAYFCLSVFPGKFTTTNLQLMPHLFNMPKLPVTPYGHYRLELRVYEKENTGFDCFCARLYFEVTPDAKAIKDIQMRNRSSAQRTSL